MSFGAKLMARLPAHEVGKVIVNLPTSINDFGDDGKNTQKKHWCFTWYDIKNPPIFNSKEMEYMVRQLEICPTSKRPHFQGYVEMRNKVSWTQMGKIFGTNRFWRKGRWASRVQARDYCRKDNSRVVGSLPEEFGNWSDCAQGRRTDLEEACECKNIEEIKSSYPATYVKYERGLKSLFGPKYITGRRTWMPDIWVYWGPSGTGKSHNAFARGGSDAYVKPSGDKWWDGYGGDEVVIWEEFRHCGNEWSNSDMLRLLDKYPMKVQVKGGYVDMLAKVIIFTSCYHPSEWMGNDTESSQLLRRIPEKQIVHLSEVYKG